MRKMLTLFLGLALLAPGSTHAGEADEITAELPADTHFVLHMKSIARMDAIAKAAAPLVKMFDEAEGARLAEVQLSALLQKELGVDLSIVDAAKPVYLGMVAPGADTPFVVAHPAGRFEGERALPEGVVARTRGPALLMAQRAELELERRGKAVPLLSGDAGIHVFVDHLTTKYKEKIDGAFGQGAMLAAGLPNMPEPMRKLAVEFVGATKNVVNATESIDYALTWVEGEALAEGLVRFKEDSGVRNALRRAGEPGGNSLVGYMPSDALLVVDSRTPPNMMIDELGGLLDRALGEGRGKAILKLMNVSGGLGDHLTGEMAVAMSFMGTAASTSSLARLKPGVDPAKVFEAYDVEAVNQAVADLGLPLEMKLEKSFAKHGETPLHRLTFESENFQIAMMAASMTTFMCAENGLFFSVQSPTAEDDLTMLLDRVRKGEKKAGAHTAAMEKLGRNRHMGITLNATALRDVLMMMAMMAPQMGQVANAIPDDFTFSTAMTLRDGNLHWRGNWPVEKIAEVARAVTQMAGPGPAPQEEEFD